MTHPNRVRMSKLTLGLLAALATAPVFAQQTSAGVEGAIEDLRDVVAFRWLLGILFDS